jgi:acetoin utilization deacetylase AcuC-like enzyme
VLSKETCQKLLVLLGGGYNSTACIKSYYNIFCGLLGNRDFLDEEEIPDTDPEQVQHTVNQLKHYLSEYWSL